MASDPLFRPIKIAAVLLIIVALGCRSQTAVCADAIMSGDASTVARLVGEGVSVNAVTDDAARSRLIHIAAESGHKDIVAYLLTHGACVDTRDASGDTPLLRAVRKRNLAVSMVLVAHGADVNARSKVGKSAIMFAALECDEKLVEMLLGRGATASARDDLGATPLHLAAINDDKPEIARMLLHSGAPLNVCDSDGNTPLHVAARFGRRKLAGFLVSQGSDIRARNLDGKTPAEFADAWGHKDMVPILVGGPAQKRVCAKQPAKGGCE